MEMADQSEDEAFTELLSSQRPRPSSGTTTSSSSTISPGSHVAMANAIRPADNKNKSASAASTAASLGIEIDSGGESDDFMDSFDFGDANNSTSSRSNRDDSTMLLLPSNKSSGTASKHLTSSTDSAAGRAPMFFDVGSPTASASGSGSGADRELASIGEKVISELRSTKGMALVGMSLLTILALVLVPRFAHYGKPPVSAEPTGGDVRLNEPLDFAYAINTAELDAALTNITNKMSEIHTYWRASEFPLVKSLADIPPSSWDIQVNKFVVMLLKQRRAEGSTASTTERASSALLPNLGHYVAVFTGSSVTAGHDNYLEEIYSAVFHRNLDGPMSSLNIALETRNVAVGNNPCLPYDACVNTLAELAGVGPAAVGGASSAYNAGSSSANIGGVDLLSWEQSMNCGRIPQPVEFFLRSAVVGSVTAGRVPPTVLLQMSGTPFWESTACDSAPASASASRPSSEFSPAEQEVNSLSFKEAAARAGHLKSMAFQKAANATLLSDHYKALGVFGLNLLPVDGYKCKGPFGPDFSTKSPSKGKSWHPGRLGHRLRGDVLAYAVLAVMKEAVERVQGGLKVDIKANKAVRAKVDGRDSSGIYLVSSKDELASIRNNAISHLRGVGLTMYKGSDNGTSRHLRQTHSRHPQGLRAVPSRSLSDSDVPVSASLSLSIPSLLLPPPLICAEEECISANTKCYTNFEPRYLYNSGLLTLVPGNVRSNQYATEVIAGEPGRTTDLSLAALTASMLPVKAGPNSDWNLTVAWSDVEAVRRIYANPRMRYADMKKVLVSSGAAGSSIDFKLDMVKGGSRVWLCQLGGGVAYPEDMGSLLSDATVTVQLNVEKTALRTPPTYKSSKPGIPVPLEAVTSAGADGCFRSNFALPPGLHVLGVAQTSAAKRVNIAYLLHW